MKILESNMLYKHEDVEIEGKDDSVMNELSEEFGFEVVYEQ